MVMQTIKKVIFFQLKINFITVNLTIFTIFASQINITCNNEAYFTPGI